MRHPIPSGWISEMALHHTVCNESMKCCWASDHVFEMGPSKNWYQLILSCCLTACWVTHWSNWVEQWSAFPNFLHCWRSLIIAEVIRGAVLSSVRLVSSFWTAKVNMSAVLVPWHSTTWWEDWDTPHRGHSLWAWLPLKNSWRPTPQKPVACLCSQCFLPKGMHPIASAHASQLIKVMSSYVILCLWCQYCCIWLEKVWCIARADSCQPWTAFSLRSIVTIFQAEGNTVRPDGRESPGIPEAFC